MLCLRQTVYWNFAAMNVIWILWILELAVLKFIKQQILGKFKICKLEFSIYGLRWRGWNEALIGAFRGPLVRPWTHIWQIHRGNTPIIGPQLCRGTIFWCRRIWNTLVALSRKPDRIQFSNASVQSQTIYFCYQVPLNVVKQTISHQFVAATKRNGGNFI